MTVSARSTRAVSQTVDTRNPELNCTEALPSVEAAEKLYQGDTRSERSIPKISLGKAASNTGMPVETSMVTWCGPERMAHA